MKFLHVIALLLSLGLSTAFGQNSFSHQVNFQNDFDKDIYICIAYLDNNPFTKGGRSVWTKMWFKCEAGESRKINFPSAYQDHYYHAHVDGDKSINWGEGEKFYLHPSNGYTILQEDQLGVEDGFLHAIDLSGDEIQLAKSKLDKVEFSQIKLGTKNIAIQ